MKRVKILFILFICWGTIICASSLWLVCFKKQQLNRFAKKLSSRQVMIYPTRAPIYDCNGVKIAWTEWEFYIQFFSGQLQSAEKFFRSFEVPFRPSFNKSTRRYTHIIPPDKTADAIKLARKYRLRVRRNIVRRTVKLSPAAQSFIGNILLHYGISGLELKYNAALQGRAGHYHIIQGTAGKIAKGSFKVMLPMQEGREIRLGMSLLELQCGLFVTEGIK